VLRQDDGIEKADRLDEFIKQIGLATLPDFAEEINGVQPPHQVQLSPVGFLEKYWVMH
jgi:hypothetical protein